MASVASWYAAANPVSTSPAPICTKLGLLVDASDELIEEGLSSGHDVFTAIGDLPFPTVALVDGKCLGGGTELVLAMDERIAVDAAGVDLVLPEVKIGLFPAWGGSQRTRPPGRASSRHRDHLWRSPRAGPTGSRIGTRL